MPFETKPEWSEIRHRVREPDLFKDDSIKTLDIGKGVSLIRGKLKSNDEWATQAVRFDKDKFDVDKAKTWVEEHPNVKKYSEPEDVEVKKKHDIKDFNESLDCRDIGGKA